MKKKMIAVSYSSLAAINRKIYTELSKTYELTLLIPKEATFNNATQAADPTDAQDPEMLRLPLKGSNPRLHYLKGIWKVLRAKRPAYIFIENDPISAFCVVACVYKLFYGGKI